MIELNIINPFFYTSAAIWHGPRHPHPAVTLVYRGHCPAAAAAAASNCGEFTASDEVLHREVCARAFADAVKDGVGAGKVLVSGV